MKVTLLLILWLVVAAGSVALAQVPQGTRVSKGPSMSFYRDTPEGKKLDYIITGDNGSDAGPSKVLISQFELRSFRNGDPKLVQIIAQAPQCVVNVQHNDASDSGPLKIFTPTTNLYVEGVGFLFTQSNHCLTISNDVKTRVVKSLLHSSVLGAARTNAAPATNQYLRIFARRGYFNLNSNTVDYADGVHAIDPQLDMTCDFLTIRFATNGTVEEIVARQNVELTTTNSGRATGDIGFYYITNGSEMLRLVTNAFWQNGDEQARANEFLYDSTRHVLTGVDHVRVQWPNPAQHANGSGPPLAGTNGFRFLYADFATLQFPPTNGPVESMRARGNVIIVNQADHSRATADQADYERNAGRVELDGHPVWWNDTIEVKGETLLADLAGKTYHAQTDAHFKMRTSSANARHSTNQWLLADSDEMEYQTNRAVFYRNVKTRLVENDRVKDKLNCDLLTVNLTSNQPESGFAAGHVYGETAPDKSGIVKTITCAQLDAWRNIKTGFMKTIIARTNVDIVEKRGGEDSAWNELTSALVTAQFSPVTNQVQQAVAEPNVVIDQIRGGHRLYATGERAVYTAGTDAQVTLAGDPVAQKDNYYITNANILIWHPGANSFNATGLFQMLPVKTNAPQKP